jgi:hypothetical protein
MLTDEAILGPLIVGALSVGDTAEATLNGVNKVFTVLEHSSEWPMTTVRFRSSLREENVLPHSTHCRLVKTDRPQVVEELVDE